MTVMRCRYENELIQALQAGILSESLIAHQQSCAECREAVAVSQALRRDASSLVVRYTPPPSSQVWAAAERHRRMAALERATLFLRALKVAGVIYIAVLAFWGIHALAARGGVTVPGLDPKLLSATIEGAGLAALLVGSGLWYTLRGDKRRVG
jgi:hypothetical protein